MPPMLCPSPVLIDHSFPRSSDELLLASKSLGNLTGLVEERKCRIILTNTLAEFVDAFEYQSVESYPLLRDIRQLLVQWLLHPSDWYHRVPSIQLANSVPHPLPGGCDSEGLAEMWSAEVGTLLALHDQKITQGEYFIGIACHKGFSDRPIADYAEAVEGERRFPIVGLGSFHTLDDSEIWNTPVDILQRDVAYESAKSNVCILGGTVAAEARGSHYKVSFSRARSWTLDCNIPIVPERFLKQLIPITNLPLNVIKYALLNGEIPEVVLRLAR